MRGGKSISPHMSLSLGVLLGCQNNAEETLTRSLVQCDTSEADESVQLKANNAPTQHFVLKGK